MARERPAKRLAAAHHEPRPEHAVRPSILGVRVGRCTSNNSVAARAPAGELCICHRLGAVPTAACGHGGLQLTGACVCSYAAAQPAAPGSVPDSPLPQELLLSLISEQGTSEWVRPPSQTGGRCCA